jgi:hypothetical protein
VILNDLLLFCCLFLLQTITFLGAQFAILRLFANERLLYSSVAAIIISVAFITLLSYFLVSDYFSGIESFAVSLLGSGLATVFGCSLYTFLGPATADRSLASHLLILLYNMPGGSSREEILLRFNPSGFIEKRIDECKKENIIADQNGTLILTEKGKIIARVYNFLLCFLRLRERNAYIEYFPDA